MLKDSHRCSKILADAERFWIPDSDNSAHADFWCDQPTMTPLATNPAIGASEIPHSPPYIHPKHKRNKVLPSIFLSLTKLVRNDGFNFLHHGRSVKTAVVTNTNTDPSFLDQCVDKINNPTFLPNRNTSSFYDQIISYLKTSSKQQTPNTTHTDALPHKQKSNPRDKQPNPTNNNNDHHLSSPTINTENISSSNHLSPSYPPWKRISTPTTNHTTQTIQHT